MTFSAFRVSGTPDPTSLREALVASRETLSAPKEFAVVTAKTGERYVITGKGASQLSGDVSVPVSDGRQLASTIGSVIGSVTNTARAGFMRWYDIALTVAEAGVAGAGVAALLDGEFLKATLIVGAGAAAAMIYKLTSDSRDAATKDARLFLKGHGVDLNRYRDGHQTVFLGVSTGNAPA